MSTRRERREGFWGIYEITQNLDHLYGDYMVRAVVVAPNRAAAIGCLMRAIRCYENGDGEVPTCKVSRLSARRIGSPDVPAERVVAVVLGGNYKFPWV